MAKLLEYHDHQAEVCTKVVLLSIPDVQHEPNVAMFMLFWGICEIVGEVAIVQEVHHYCIRFN